MKGAQVHVRLEPELKARLEKVAAATGIDASSLIRIAIQGIVNESEANEGRIVLPFHMPIAAESRAPYNSRRTAPKK